MPFVVLSPKGCGAANSQRYRTGHLEVILFRTLRLFLSGQGQGEILCEVRLGLSKSFWELVQRSNSNRTESLSQTHRISRSAFWLTVKWHVSAGVRGCTPPFTLGVHALCDRAPTRPPRPGLIIIIPV